MQIKEIMTPHVETVDAETSIGAAAKRMRDLDVGVLPVSSASGIVGVITDRDIVIRGVAEQADPTATPVSQLMTDEVLCLSQDDTVSDAKIAMEHRQIHRLLVTDEAEKVVGILSLGDLAVRGGKELAGDALQKVSDPTQPDRQPPR